MGYQALLFCHDEKTARTVTPVLTELDFEVTSCTEPFAAVKKLMEAHFDALVVDCDNEQNATLLFKSAHNTPNNQSALAVALVEGQAGVAKAFRIGANLVLTKPINVEQAKSTLRVARGLLRKNENKAAAGTVTAKARPAVPAPSPASSAPVPSMTMPREDRAEIHSAVSSREVPQVREAPTQESVTAESKTLPKIESAPAIYGIAGSAAGAAPAKEKISSAVSQEKTSAVIAEAKADSRSAVRDDMQSAFEEAEAASKDAGAGTGAAVLSEPSFAFAQTEASASGSKTILMVFAAVVLVAIAAYAAWTKFGYGIRSSSNAGASSASDAKRTANVPEAANANRQPSSASVPVPSIAAAPAPNAVTVKPSSPQKNSAAGETQTVKTELKAGLLPAATATPSSNDVAGSISVARPIVMKKASSASGAALSVDADAPAIGDMPVPTSGAMPALLSSSGSMQAPRLQTLNISQGVSRGLLIKQVQPKYPADAMRLRVEGPVKLLATVSKSGSISAVKVIEGNSQLAYAATDAVKQWKYKPYLLNGEPVEIQTEITVNFKLPR